MTAADINGLILGFDPGGVGQLLKSGRRSKGRFGWSICQAVDGELLPPGAQTGRAQHALNAITTVKTAIAKISGQPTVLAAGIDAPMFWSEEGWDRSADDELRQKLENDGFSKGGVLYVNGMRGGALVQGTLLGKYLKEEWPALQITESHPGVLRYLLQNVDQSELEQFGLGQFRVKELIRRPVTHENDATLAAISAWAILKKPEPLTRWRNLYDPQAGYIQPLGTPVSYWMPIG